MTRIAHIFKKGASIALCHRYIKDGHRTYRIDVPRRETVPTSDDSVLCEECNRWARAQMAHGAHQVRMMRLQARVHEAAMASQKG